MSTLTENVQKVVDAHAALKTAIEGKGVTVPAGTKLTGMPALVDQIQTGGGGGEPTNTRAVFAYDNASSIVVPNTLVVDMTAMTEFNNCFGGCSNLTSLTLPAGFGQNATNLNRCFWNCENLTSLTLPDGFGQNATDLGYCFNSCSNLTSLTLPDGFGQNATDFSSCFSYCTSLTSLTLPAGFGQNVTNLNRCFSSCTSLTSLTLPDGFGQNATDLSWCFDVCKKLQSLTLPDGFGQNSWNLQRCFYYCEMLTTITGNPKFKVDISFSMSTKLTHDSLMVVINGLQTVTSSQTLELGSKNLNKLTEEEKQIATGKGWTLA